MSNALTNMMVDFVLPNSRELLPTFCTNCPDGVSFCPRWGLFLPRFHPQPLFFTPPSHTPFGDMYVHKTPPPRPPPTPPHPTPPQNTPFQKPPPRPAPPRLALTRAGSRPPASCSALQNALRVVSFHLQSTPARAAAQMRRCASGSINATA